MNTVPLHGCAPSPLAHYLKALGVLRLVAEQRDASASALWKGDAFVLQSMLDRDGLVNFFLHEYRPTPILVPWSGGDFFAVNRKIKPDDLKGVLSKRPTSSKVIEAVLATTTQRLLPYREALQRAFAAMDLCGVGEKKDIEGSGGAQKRRKADLLQALRNSLPDDTLSWVDAAVVIKADAFSPNNLLGSGGGSDGNSHFSDNFMQALWVALVDFDSQRAKPVVSSSGRTFDSSSALVESLFAEPGNNTQLENLSPVLFDSSRVGGPNSVSGFDSDAASNPWDFIFMLEGACLLAGALSKKIGAANPPVAHCPFLLSASPVGAGSLGQVESTGKELWLPLWSSPTSAPELKDLFSKGRIEAHNRVAAQGLDAAQAVSQYGVDRGIQSFQRIGLFRGRIGGDNYLTSTHLGRFIVARNPGVDLLADFDLWLTAFRDKAETDRAPASVKRSLRQMEAAVFDACQHGDADRIQQVLTALGSCERSMARSLKWTQESFLKPVPPLSSRWLQAADNGSTEYRLAASLASVHGKYGNAFLSLRRHLEPIKMGVKDGSLWVNWDEHAGVDVVWHEGDATAALNDVMARRLMLAQKGGAETWPDTGRRFAELSDIASFIEGRIDLTRFADLMWGLALLDWPQVAPSTRSIPMSGAETMPGAAFALMKLCFAGSSVRNVSVPLVPVIHQRASAGQGAQATQLAARRLRASGLAPAVEQVHQQGPSMSRAAAALLFPIAHFQINALAESVLRPATSNP